MNKYLKIALYCFLIAFVLIMLWFWVSGCIVSESYPLVCRHNAVTAVISFKDYKGGEAYILVGKRDGEAHAQGMVFLSLNTKQLVVGSPCELESVGEIYTLERFLTLMESNSYMRRKLGLD